MREGSRPDGVGLGIAGERLRVRDRACFFASLFAPADAREGMWLVAAVFGELLRALGASERLVGAMRVQWWREVADGEAKRHELATPLAEALAAGRVPPAAVMMLCDAADEALTTDEGTPSPEPLWRALGEAFGMVLGVEAPVAARLGALWVGLGMGGLPGASAWPRAALPAALPAAGQRARMPRAAMVWALVTRRA